VACRAPSPELLRDVYHSALSLYLDPFLNVPLARLPEQRPAALDALPSTADDLLAHLDDALDREVAPFATIRADTPGTGLATCPSRPGVPPLRTASRGSLAIGQPACPPFDPVCLPELHATP